MTTFKHVLVPVDFSAVSDEALDVAVDLVAKFDAKLTLLHVCPPSLSGYGYDAGFVWPIDEMIGKAGKELDAWMATVTERCPDVERAIACGDAWRQILATAAVRGADLIVMGAHGWGAVSHFPLGSVAEKVVRLSPIPVLTVSSKGDAQRPRRSAPEAAVPAKDDPEWSAPPPLIRL